MKASDLTDGSVLVADGASKSTRRRISIYSAYVRAQILSPTLSQVNSTQSMSAHCVFIGWPTKLLSGGAGKLPRSAPIQ
jgi:hypothetical protein